MSKRLITATLGAAVSLIAAATTAEARISHHPEAGLYGQGVANTGEASSPRLTRTTKKRSAYTGQRAGKRRTSEGRRSGKKRYSRSRMSGRSVTAGMGGGGSSRTCLQPAAKALLARIEGQFGPMQIISTCRPGAVIAGSGKPSKHRNGMAIDFNAGNRKGAVVQWLIANHHSGGTMTYRGMGHVHVDIGHRFVSLGSGGRRRG